MFEKEFEYFLQEQMKRAEGQRLEMLQRDLTGTKKLLQRVLLPVFGSFEGLMLEHEMVTGTGARIYADVFHTRLRIAFEEDHFVTHAEKITRDRFSYERARARTVAIFRYSYFPYSRDELDQKPEFCQRNLFELVGRLGTLDRTGLTELPVYEREIIRCAIHGSLPFRLAHASEWLHLKKETCRKVIRCMKSKGLLEAVGGSELRSHEFKLTVKAINLLYRS